MQNIYQRLAERKCNKILLTFKRKIKQNFLNPAFHFRYGKVQEGDNVFKFLKSRDVPCDLENDTEMEK